MVVIQIAVENALDVELDARLFVIVALVTVMVEIGRATSELQSR